MRVILLYICALAGVMMIVSGVLIFAWAIRAKAKTQLYMGDDFQMVLLLLIIGGSVLLMGATVSEAHMLARI